MNFKLVLKTYSQLRQLNDDERAKLEWLMGLSDTERELLAETLGPPVKAKSAKPATRKFKKCDVCGVSKRAAHHRDVDHPDYHVFDEGAPKTTEKKSARATDMAAQLNKNLESQRRVADNDIDVPLTGVEARGEVGDVTATRDYDTPERCAHIRDDNKPCRLLVDHNVHQMKTAMGYHEFVAASPEAAAASGD